MKRIIINWDWRSFVIGIDTAKDDRGLYIWVFLGFFSLVILPRGKKK